MSRARLKQVVGLAISRLQDVSSAFDDLAAEILAVERTDLPCITQLLFVGPASVDELSERLRGKRAAIQATVTRLQLAGYARVHADGDRIELTEHAREWIGRIWGPLRKEGFDVLDAYSTAQLMILASFLGRAGDVQEGLARKLRAWLEQPASPARRPHMRGGLSPGALRRVQLFVEANLGGPIHLNDLALRAGLSLFHFSRAFKQSAGMTPRAFVEERRVERAKRLLTESALPLADIAGECGFGTQSHLTTTFKRRTGFTPGAYRRGRG